MTMETLFSLIKAGAASTPIGSSIVTGINEFVPSVHDKALRESVDNLVSQIDYLSERLDAENVRREEFADLFKNCYFVMQRTQYREKLRAATNILTNALLKEEDTERLLYTELDHFTRCLDNLSIGALEVLHVAFDIAKKSRKARDSNALNKKNCS